MGCFFHHARKLSRYTRCYFLAVPFSRYMRCFSHYVRWLIHYTRCFLCYIHGTSFSLVLKRVQQRKEVKMAATMDRLELFHREKSTPDIISMLSTHEMNKLKITNRVDITNLRLQCCTYGRQKPEKTV